MSGERPQVPRPLRASHIRGEPFLKASDLVEDEPLQVKWTLEKLGTIMVEAFNETHRRIDEEGKSVTEAMNALAVRVAKVEGDAAWKTWAVKGLKLAGPALVGALAARFPEAAKLLGTLLGAVAAP